MEYDRSPKSVYITIGNKTFYIDDSTDEAIMELLSPTYCKNCGSTLGLDCGEAEPDYNHEYCSKGCCHEHIKGYDASQMQISLTQLN